MLSDLLISAIALTKRFKDSSKPNSHNFLKIEEQGFYCTLPWKVDFLRTALKRATWWWGPAYQKEKWSVDQVWRIENWAEKIISKPFSCVGVFEVFVLQAVEFKVKYS